MNNKINFLKMGVVALLTLLPAIAFSLPAETPTWVDAAVASKEHPGFEYLGEYQKGTQAIQVVPCQGKFYLSVYKGGLPGDGWNGGKIGHEWIESGEIAKRLEGFAKRDRSAELEFPKPPKNAIVLFDGSSMDAWANGKQIDGLLQAGAKTKRVFKDFRLHLEYMVPYKPELPLSHPDRGNSGIFALGAYEVQVADTFGLDASAGAWKEIEQIKKPSTWCGSVYGLREADINMCLAPLSWQSFDIDFTAARFDGDRKITPARISVWQNGVLIHESFELPEGTGGGPKGARPEVAEGALYIQRHHNPVQYRNIWVIEN